MRVGQVAGWISTAPSKSPARLSRVFRSSSSSAPINLGLLQLANANGYGYSYAVSNSGQVVGYASGSGSVMHGFLWNQR